MKIKNKKGFTLIELLAVIVILGVLLAIAVPAVTKYVSSTKQSAFVSDLKMLMKTSKQEALMATYPTPVNPYDATIISLDKLRDELESGGKTTSYGGEYEYNNSCVIIVNTRSAENPKNTAYVAALDTNGYGIGVTNDDRTLSAATIELDELKNSNVLQLGRGNGIDCNASVGSKINIDGHEVNVTWSTYHNSNE